LATEYVDILFGPYLPDFGGIPNPQIPGYLVDAINVRSTPNGYRGMPSFADVAGATVIGSSTASGLGAGFEYASVHSVFFSDGSDMFESRSEGTDTWQNVSPASGTVGQTGDFAQFGADVVFVDSARAPIKKSFNDSHATLFTDLGGSPPTAGCAARIGRHLVLGQLSTDNYAVRTSAIGDHEDWPTPGTADARAKQAITESLNEEFGVVRRILGGEKLGIVVQERALTRMAYVGGSAVYQFDTYERIDGRGDILFSRPVSDGTAWYYYSEGGFFITDGYAVRNLSNGKIDEALFLNSLSHPNGTSLEAAHSSVYDPRRGLVLFTSVTLGGYQLVYNVTDQTFTWMNSASAMSFLAAFNTASAVTASGGRQIYNVKGGASQNLQKLSGTTSTIAMQTGYIEIDQGYNVQLQGAHLLGTGTGSLTLAAKTAATSADCDVSQSGFTSLTAASLGQKKTARATAQYMAFRVTGTGAESQLIRGIRVYYTRAQPAS
jgi:hypothetical protein